MIQKIQHTLVINIFLLSLIILSCQENQTQISFGSIEITSIPTGATIYLDNKDTGKETPNTLTGINEGAHTIKLSLENYIEWKKEVYIYSGRTATVSAKLSQWEIVKIPDVPNDIYFGQIQFINKNVGWVNTNYDMYKTQDGGLTWSKISGPSFSSRTYDDIFWLNNESQAWYFANGTSAMGLYGIFYRTLNGGNYWSNMYYIQGFSDGILDVFILNDNNAWCIGKKINRSTWKIEYSICHFFGNGEWKNNRIEWPIPDEKIFFLNEKEGMGIGSDDSDHYFFITDDGGLKWEKISKVPSGYRINDIHFVEKKLGYISTDNGLLYTNDGGKIWNKHKDAISDLYLENIIFLDSKNGWIGGEKGIILKTTDSGVNWEKMYIDTYNVINDIYFIDFNNGWATGEDLYKYQR